MSIPPRETNKQTHNQNAENWTQALTCIGHRFDVVHVDWAADDSLLASARYGIWSRSV